MSSLQLMSPLKKRLDDVIYRNLVSPFLGKKKIVWLTSYPKSGSNFLRSILTSLFSPTELMNNFMPDIHEFGIKKSLEIADPITVNDQDLYFLKTHKMEIPDSQYLSLRTINHRFVCIYRHPLDVFLSSINHLYITKNSKRFINGKIQSVDELSKSGELDTYFQRFYERLTVGNDAFTEMCGGNCVDYARFWLRRCEQGHKNISVLRYEDLAADPFSTLKSLAASLGRGETELESALDLAGKKTKQDGKFYWKQKIGNFNDYLSQAQIADFTSKYQDALEHMGYC